MNARETTLPLQLINLPNKHTNTLSYSVFTQVTIRHSAQLTTYIYIHFTDHALISKQILQINQESITISISL